MPLISPAGMDSPGRPARFTERVYISSRYIASGSSDFAPRAKAVPGAAVRDERSYATELRMTKSILSV